MVDIVVRGAKYCSAYWTNEDPDGEWTMPIPVPAITKNTFLCYSFTCWTWIIRRSSFRIGSCSLLYIGSHYWVKVIFRLEINKKQHIKYKIMTIKTLEDTLVKTDQTVVYFSYLKKFVLFCYNLHTNKVFSIMKEFFRNERERNSACTTWGNFL